jgi:hypothetical protein
MAAKATPPKATADVAIYCKIDAELNDWIREQMAKTGCSLQFLIVKALRKLSGQTGGK